LRNRPRLAEATRSGSARHRPRRRLKDPGSGLNQGIAVACYRATAIVSTGVELKKKLPAS
jgi:hypothetical protein